jgi:hypothetical protein
MALLTQRSVANHCGAHRNAIFGVALVAIYPSNIQQAVAVLQDPISLDLNKE